MIDKRIFHHFLNQTKDDYPEHLELLEAVQEKFEHDFTPLSENEKRALLSNPVQFVKRIYEPSREWTTKLHIWAEHGVENILKLDPMYLAFKNSYEDSVLMCLVVGATGIYTEKINYPLIEKILNTELAYEDADTDKDNNDTIVVKSAIDEKDANEQTIIDYLIDFAYGTNLYKDEEPDLKLQEILKNFSGSSVEHGEDPDKDREVPKENSEFYPSKKVVREDNDIDIEEKSDKKEEPKKKSPEENFQK
jgi:hypothetical protein